jgi:hypothetical protein
VQAVDKDEVVLLRSGEFGEKLIGSRLSEDGVFAGVLGDIEQEDGVDRGPFGDAHSLERHAGLDTDLKIGPCAQGLSETVEPSCSNFGLLEPEARRRARLLGH